MLVFPLDRWQRAAVLLTALLVVSCGGGANASTQPTGTWHIDKVVLAHDMALITARHAMSMSEAEFERHPKRDEMVATMKPTAMETQISISLEPDGTFRHVSEYDPSAPGGPRKTSCSGSWRLDQGRVLLEVSEEDGAPAKRSLVGSCTGDRLTLTGEHDGMRFQQVFQRTP